MDEINTTISTEHRSGEAPISAELREQASQSLSIIKQLVEESRRNGSLTKEDEATLQDWLVKDVEAPAMEAQQHDIERQQVLASAAVDSAVGAIHEGQTLYQERDGSLSTPGVHNQIVQSGEIRPVSGTTS